MDALAGCTHMCIAPCARVALPITTSARRSATAVSHAHKQTSRCRIRRRQHGTRCVCPNAKAAATAEAVPSAASASWEDAIAEDDHMGPAFRATLGMLEWPRLCEHVAAFASTSLGKAAVKGLSIPATQEESEQLVAETAAMRVLESEYAAALDFGGINTSTAQTAIRRAARGGLLSGPQLVAVSSVLRGGGRLRQAISTVVGQAAKDGRPPELAAPLSAAVKGITVDKAVAAAIDAALKEDGSVKESASEEVRRTRGRVATLKGRLRSLLGNQPGEVTEQGGRMCVAVPANEGSTPKGILLGGSAGVQYIEPPAAVGPNNDLAAARGEAAAAEEAVLWDMTTQVIDAAYNIEAVLDMVVRLDVASARTRYSEWIGGNLPAFAPFARAARGRKTAKKGGGGNGSGSSRQGGDAGTSRQPEDDADHIVRLRRLRHPLLLGEYLLQKDQQQTHSRNQRVGGGARRSRRQFSNRKADAELRSTDSDASDSDDEAQQNLRQPVPVDVCVRPETRAVIITGPNTGGKTAALKAFGLAVLMARTGLAPPAAHPVRLPPFAQVLADMGDEQSLSASLSTFSGHLRRIQALRAEAHGKALVLLDEVGTGTEPVEGAALGIALLRTLAVGGAGGAALTFATTHHSALTSLKYEDERFENVSMEFDEARLQPTYRLLWGIPGRSNALNIAQRLGLDSTVVDAARERLGSAEAVNDTIVDLEKLRRQTEADEDAAAAAQSEESRLRAAIAQSRREIADARAQQQAEATRDVTTACREAVATVQRLGKQQSAAAVARAEAQAEQEAIKEEARKLEAQKAERWLPAVGEAVHVPRLGGQAKVLAAKKNGKLTLQSGPMKLTVSVDEVRRLD